MICLVRCQISVVPPDLLKVARVVPLHYANIETTAHYIYLIVHTPASAIDDTNNASISKFKDCWIKVRWRNHGEISYFARNILVPVIY